MRQLGIVDVCEASDLAGLQTVMGRNPGVQMVVVDVDLPGLQRDVGLRRLRTQYPSALLVVVAISRARDLVIDCLRAGVHGYVLKDLAGEEMMRAFEAIMSGHIYVPPFVSDVSTRRVAAAAIIHAPGNAVLTDRQMEVLNLVASGRSNKEIARSLQIAEGTVKVHIAAACRALGVHNRVSAAVVMQGRPRNENSVQTAFPNLFGDDLVACPDSGGPEMATSLHQ
jgi:DNA-binding NarL/FixJ family response regulator